MSDDLDPIDSDFDALEALLASARSHARSILHQAAARRAQKSAQEVSEDYASRLAEKAVFRRLLSDEALDGVRFRWLFSTGQDRAKGAMYARLYGMSLEDIRKMVDKEIAAEEKRDV